MIRSIVIMMSLFTFFLISCSESTVPKEVNIGDLGTIEVPSELSLAKNLNKDAIFQMENKKDDFYVVIVEDNKVEFKEIVEEVYGNPAPNFKVYAELANSSIASSLNLKQDTELEQTSVNGLPAYLTSYDGDLNGTLVHYKLACIEGKDRYYQIVNWTTMVKKKKYESVMTSMLESFKEKK